MKGQELQIKKSSIEILPVNNIKFKKYGNVVDAYDFSEIIKYMENETGIPEEGNIYVPADASMQQQVIKAVIQQNIYGEMPIQIGYCNGRNSTLNGLEYHKGSEVNVAVTDLALLLGCVQDIKDGKYQSGNVEAFFLPKGTAIELYATTLHFAPCKTQEEGFKCVVILPQGTNLALEQNTGDFGNNDDRSMLFAKNKWLLVHPDRKVLIEKGAYIGIEGENLEVAF